MNSAFVSSYDISRAKDVLYSGLGSASYSATALLRRSIHEAELRLSFEEDRKRRCNFFTYPEGHFFTELQQHNVEVMKVNPSTPSDMLRAWRFSEPPKPSLFSRILDHSAGAIKGGFLGVGDFAEMLLHPYDNFLKPNAQFLADATVIVSAHLPRTHLEELKDKVFVEFCDLITGNKTIYDNAVQNMQDRYATAKNAAEYVAQAASVEQVEIAARVIVGAFIAPAMMGKVIGVLKNIIPHVTLEKTPQLFRPGEKLPANNLKSVNSIPMQLPAKEGAATVVHLPRPQGPVTPVKLPMQETPVVSVQLPKKEGPVVPVQLPTGGSTPSIPIVVSASIRMFEKIGSGPNGEYVPALDVDFNLLLSESKIKYLTPEDVRKISHNLHSEGSYCIYVIQPTKEGGTTVKIVSSEQYIYPDGAKLTIGHLDLARGKPVISAGEVKLQDGKITWINNQSGHYRPRGEYLKDVIEGAFVDAGYLEAVNKYHPILMSAKNISREVNVKLVDFFSEPAPSAPLSDLFNKAASSSRSNLDRYGIPFDPPKFQIDKVFSYETKIAMPIPRDETLSTSWQVERLPEGRHRLVYIISEAGELFIHPETYTANSKTGMFSPNFPNVKHSELAQLLPVIASGHVTVINSKEGVLVQFIDNLSGHYKPNGEHLKTLVEHVFNKQGFNATGKYTEYDFTKPKFSF